MQINDENSPPFLFLNEYKRRLEEASNSAKDTQNEAIVANFSNVLQETESVTANLSHFVSIMGIISSESAPYVWTQQWHRKSPFDEKIVRDLVIDATADHGSSLSRALMILASERVKCGATHETILRDFPKHGLCEARSIFLCSEAAHIHGDLETATQGFNDAIQLSPYISIFHRRGGMLAWNQGDHISAKIYFEAACATKNLNWLTGDTHKVRPVLIVPIPKCTNFLYYQHKLFLVPPNLDYIATFIYHDRMYTILNSLVLRLWIQFKVPEILGLLSRLHAKTKKSPKEHVKSTYVPIMSDFRYKVLKGLFRIQVLKERSNLSSLGSVLDLLKFANRK